ncbi:methyltransferase family protein [Cellulomonas marina]|uniref:Protein-S-isoprenylcysteine O-methyltransferase Ste14 n=1 Tax=Cellulomonas marina TaxID=988821 RepID=A0A1I1AW88_9CELL|nr:isoprenylcysteine carboxylmethyltransferase family protein [Cellulomonas marina]GIG30709.1 hypothetical protein Cma02nite_33090 [Cellulomonas marina]SFB42127.1 Protein-S-isoprenylcysteine O-methyltransferase Ste14 [Cellulomonas marina]
MNHDSAATLAFTMFVVGVVATFGVRTWAHRRRTGASGFSGISGSPWSAAWWGGVLFVAALLLAAAGLTLAALGVVEPPPGVPAALGWVGVVVAVVGFAVTLAAQSGMGASWRIGVDQTERTELVTTGLFRLVRNPIFTAMCAALVGLMLMSPSVITVGATICLIAAVELQVRVVEEPYLLATHGATYARYTAEVGRFLPGLGRSMTSRQRRVESP